MVDFLSFKAAFGKFTFFTEDKIMQSKVLSSTLCLSLLASLAVAAPSEPTQSGASQNSGVLQTQKVGVLDTQGVLLAQNSSTQATKDLQALQGTLLAVNENAQTIGEAQNSGFLGTLLGTGGGGGRPTR